MSIRRANAVCRIKEIPLLVESYCRMNGMGMGMGMGMGESHGSYGRFVCESEEKVIFKKDRKNGEVVAFFPETMFDGSVNRGNIMSYAHDGQSGEASLDYFHECIPCRDESEYAELLNELEWYLNQGPEEGHTTIKVVRKPYYGRGSNQRKVWPSIDVGESVNDAAEELAEVEEPIKITKIDEPAYPASDSWDKDASDIDYLIDEYINNLARTYYTNGIIPEDEKREIRDSLRAVRIFFDYWCKEDDENYAGYDEREALFIIDTDGRLCNVDWFGYGSDYSVEEWNYLVNAACEHIGVKYKGSAAPLGR